jgi:hypothetical protein
MHDQLSFSVEGAIQRHANQAASSRDGFNRLNAADQRKLLAFLASI